MLLGLIIALIFGVDSDTSEFASYIPHIKKEIRNHVPEGSRKDTLLLLVKDYDKTIKKYDKKKKKLKKTLHKAGSDREVSTDDFLNHYERYYNARMELISSLIGYRIMFQEQITQEELLLVAEEAGFTSKKERRKEGKQEKKAEKKLDKVFEDINNIVLKHIEDSTKTELVSRSLLDFETTIYAYVDEAKELVAARHLMLDDNSATREEIDEIYNRSNQLMYQASRDYVELREIIINSTNEKEWRAINKELDAFLKT